MLFLILIIGQVLCQPNQTGPLIAPGELDKGILKKMVNDLRESKPNGPVIGLRILDEFAQEYANNFPGQENETSENIEWWENKFYSLIPSRFIHSNSLLKIFSQSIPQSNIHKLHKGGDMHRLHELGFNF